MTKVKCTRCGRKVRITDAIKRGDDYFCKRCATDVDKGKQFPSEVK